MRWLVTAFRLRWTVPLVLLLSLLAGIGGGMSLPLVSLLRQATSGLPLATVLALSVPLALTFVLDEVARPASATSVRPMRLYVYAAGAVIALCALVGALVAAAASGSYGAAAVFIRGALGLSGVLLLAVHVLPVAYAAVVPAAYILVAGVVGRPPGSKLAAWAWVAERSPTAEGTIVAGVLFLAGVSAYALRRPMLAAAR